MNLLAVAAFGLGRAYKGLQAFVQQWKWVVVVEVVGKVDTGLKETLALAAVAGRMGTALGVVAGVQDIGHVELVETSAGCYNQSLMAVSGACVR